jgi:hypothetical protein
LKAETRFEVTADEPIAVAADLETAILAAVDDSAASRPVVGASLLLVLGATAEAVHVAHDGATRLARRPK